MMKKALSIVLSVLMILSACVIAFALEGDNKIPALTVNIYTHGTGSSAVSLYYGDSTYRGTSIREYSPGNEDITVNVYTPFRDQVTDAVLSGLITGTEVPAGYGSLMTGAESVSGIKNFVGAAVCQDDIPVDGSVVAVKLSDIKTIADTAAKNAARAAAQGFVDALNAGDIEILSSSVGTPTVTAKYGGYATDNAFIATYKPSVTETVSVWVNTSAGDYTIQGFIDLENKKLILNGDVLSMLASNVTGPAVRSMFSGLGMPIDSSNSADITKLLKDSAYDAAKDAVTVVFDHLSALAEAKAAAKAELAAYKSAEDYRAAEREDLSAAIAAGSAAIAAAADVEAVAAALADAKAALDAIKTDAQLTAEELAADKAAFDAYKFNLTAAVQAMAQAGDSDAAARIIADAASDVALLDYDETKTLDENKAAADAIADIADALAAQRAADAVEALIGAIGTVEYTAESKEKIDAAKAAYDALTDAQKALVDPDAATALNDASAAYALLENKAAFEEYREAVNALADGMKLEGDSDACIALIGAAKEAVDAVVYDESKTLDENKEALDAAAALTQLATDLADQRAAEADDPKEVFEEYRATLLTLAEALRRDGDSEAVTALIDEAVAALTDYVYDEAKPLAENKDALGEVLALFAGSVKSQRQAERQEALNHEPCSLCGEHHTGSLLENFIGVIHGIIWIMRSIALIAA